MSEALNKLLATQPKIRSFGLLAWAERAEEMLKAQAAEIESLRAEVAALKADAELYRLLKTLSWYVGPQPSCEYGAWVDYEDNNCGELDAAINAAKDQQ